jgi:glutamate-1-semialdehyde 2,1-aminomutase
LAVACGLKTLHILRLLDYNTIDRRCRDLARGIQQASVQAKVRCVVNQCGSLLTAFFTGRAVRSFADAAACDRVQYARFFRSLLEQGVYVPPSQWEAWFVSFAHTDEDIRRTLNVVPRAFQRVRAGRKRNR